MSKDEMQKILSNSPGITYNLDPIPSALLKKCSDAVLNLGEIMFSLKDVQIRPMLKKVNLDSIHVSQLSSYIKLMFSQFDTGTGGSQTTLYIPSQQ